MVDVAWVNATDMLVLGAETKNAAVVPYEISDDALNITKEIAPVDWDAGEISRPAADPDHRRPGEQG